MLKLWPELCLKCGACVPLCPTEALFLNRAGINWVKPNCTFCYDCALFCPVKALESVDG